MALTRRSIARETHVVVILRLGLGDGDWELRRVCSMDGGLLRRQCESSVFCQLSYVIFGEVSVYVVWQRPWQVSMSTALKCMLAYELQWQTGRGAYLANGTHGISVVTVLAYRTVTNRSATFPYHLVLVVVPIPHGIGNKHPGRRRVSRGCDIVVVSNQ